MTAVLKVVSTSEGTVEISILWSLALCSIDNLTLHSNFTDKHRINIVIVLLPVNPCSRA